MFRGRGQQVSWEPRDGLQAEVHALVSLYEPRGDFQLLVQDMRPAGRGARHEAFQKLKEKLAAEGLFDESLKRPLPFLPRAIGVVTSPDAAALEDVLTTLARRNPSIPVIVYPAPVQGSEAPRRIARALAIAADRRECDVLVLCRGGGSIEDLWSFNDEALARAIRASPIPVVCGVGHEIDFTIADFAADRRAPTPTAAAELVSPLRGELIARTSSLAQRVRGAAARDLQVRAQTLDYLARRLAHPARRLAEQARLAAALRLRLARAMGQRMEGYAWRAWVLLRRTHAVLPHTAGLEALLRANVERAARAANGMHAARQARVASLEASLEHLSPLRVLERGYSLVRDASGRLVRDARALKSGDPIDLRFARGSAKARVESTGS
jgi:exodeoxyribonuclease VII large subunit